MQASSLLYGSPVFSLWQKWNQNVTKIPYRPDFSHKKSPTENPARLEFTGREGGIRTHGPFDRTPDFEFDSTYFWRFPDISENPAQPCILKVSDHSAYHPISWKINVFHGACDQNVTKTQFADNRWHMGLGCDITQKILPDRFSLFHHRASAKSLLRHVFCNTLQCLSGYLWQIQCALPTHPVELQHSRHNR